MSKFTAGPWEDGPDPCVIIGGSGKTGQYQVVAEAYTVADKKLISAAPEMYYALQDLVRFMKMGDKAGALAVAHAYENAIKAMKKAEGQI